MSLAAVGTRGAVATGHPVATAVAASVLEAGGSAADAVVAASATLWVVQPNQSGPGGDGFALVHPGSEHRPAALMGSGPASTTADPIRLAQQGDGIHLPLRGMRSASVPGEVELLRELHERWGRRPWDELIRPAADRAERGMAVSRPLARWISEAWPLLADDAATAAIYLPDGQAPRPGDILHQQALADSLHTLAEDGPRSLYEGKLADRVVEASQGAFVRSDLSSFRSEVTEPLELQWKRRRIFVPPPPSQAVMLLLVLGMLADDDLSDPYDPAVVHLLAEAHKRAVTDRMNHLGDPDFGEGDTAALLSEEHLATLRKDLRLDASDVITSVVAPSETTSLSVADQDGLLVSYIASLSNSFGSGRVAGETGIFLNNRAGRGFHLRANRPNALQPGKRAMHTLCPVLVLDGDEALALNTPGGDRQPQFMAQALVAGNAADRAVALDRACNGPRWHVTPGTDPHNWGKPTQLHIEEGFPPEAVDDLVRRGHQIVTHSSHGGGGGVQAVMGRQGRWWAASDSRVDGAAVAL